MDSKRTPTRKVRDQQRRQERQLKHNRSDEAEALLAWSASLNDTRRTFGEFTNGRYR